MNDNTDLLGGNTAPQGGADGSSTPNGGLAGAVSQGIRDANPNAQKDDAAEESLVKETWTEYQTARDFDKFARVGFTKDRRYAAGLADPRWASDANIIGSFIDILTGFIYAQNPDLDITAAEKVGDQPDTNSTDFAETAN